MENDKVICITGARPVIYKEAIVVKNKPSDTFLKKSYTPSKGDLLYIHPSCTIPRFKLKDFCETHDIKVTRDKTKANVKFCGITGIKQFYVNIYSPQMITKKFIFKYINYLKSRSVDLLDSLEQALLTIDSSADYFVAPYGFQSNIQNGYGNYLRHDMRDFDEDEPNKEYDTKDLDFSYNIIYADDYQDYLSITTEYHDEKALTTLLNSSLVLDEESYKGLCNLFESSDVTNHVLAMESMANCNYKESAVFLLLLFKDYSYVSKMYYSKTKNHVNFKSLLNFFNLTLYRNNLDFDNIIEKLIELDVMNNYNMNVLLPLINEEAINNLPSKYFKFSSIIPNDFVQEFLNQDIQNISIEEDEVDNTEPLFI